MAKNEWHYSKGDDHQLGPVSATELQTLVEKGELHPDDLVWKEGMDEWIPARRVKGLDFPETKKRETQSSQSGFDTEKIRPTYRDAQQTVEEASKALWFLDLNFDRFVAASIIRVIWSIYLVVALLTMGLSAVAFVLREPILKACLYMLGLVIGMGLFTLMFRVWLEAFMVIFRIAEYLREMKGKLSHG